MKNVRFFSEIENIRKNEQFILKLEKCTTRGKFYCFPPHSGGNILFTYNEPGKDLGYWRHINPQGSTSPAPNLGENEEGLVHIPDRPGWTCKVGYYGRKSEHEKIVWHTAFSNSPRMTLGYVIFEEKLWQNTVEEIAGEELVWPLAPYDPNSDEYYSR